MDKFQIENRYLVLKMNDISNYLTPAEQTILYTLTSKIDALRIRNDRGILKCVVVEHDWPEYDKVWEMLEERIKRGE